MINVEEIEGFLSLGFSFEKLDYNRIFLLMWVDSLLVYIVEMVEVEGLLMRLDEEEVVMIEEEMLKFGRVSRM